MTRVLSELLGATGPTFQLNLQQLENSAGRPSADIRLTTEIQNGMRSKLIELGLDPQDTTGQELYVALGSRLRLDEARLEQALKKGAKKTDDPVALVAFTLRRELADQSTLAMKSASAKRLLKANIPKKAMKALGYRSADSMLKHETAASLLAAAELVENEQWTKKLLTAYAKLKPTDFEIRKLAIEYPSTKKWQALSETAVAIRRHNILAFKELGAVVLLPLPSAAGPSRPELPILTTMVLTIHAVNEILAAGTFLKLHQFGSGFGAVVRDVVLAEPVLSAKMLDQPVSWNLVQQYFARTAHQAKTDLFEPVVQAEDLVWKSVEQMLAAIEPSLEFWRGTGHLGMLEAGKAVSCNLTDLILSHCNRLSYPQRYGHYLQHELKTELLLRYMSPEKLQQGIGQLGGQAFGVGQKQLATELVAA